MGNYCNRHLHDMLLNSIYTVKMWQGVGFIGIQQTQEESLTEELHADLYLST